MKTLLSLLVLPGLATSANAEQRFEFASFRPPAPGRVVVPVVEGEASSGVAATIDE